MLRGELGQEPFRVYKRTVFADLLYERITKDPFLEPQEAQVWLRVGNEFESAFVPLYIVDEEKNTVRGRAGGRKTRENPRLLPAHQLWSISVQFVI